MRGVGEVGCSPSVRYFLSRPPQKIFSDSYQRHHKIKPYSSPQLRKNFFGDPDLDKKFWACCLCAADGAGKGGKRAPVGFFIIARPNRSLSCRLSVAVLELVGGSGVVVSLIVHRFYLTKKKVYLLDG